jgi:dihydrofolate synthase / folylpolyglutamate synthase
MFSTYQHFLEHLNAKGLFRMKLGLERMREALLRLPPLTGSVIQVVGTNGKGSTSAFLEGVARAHGKRTGLFTSPHFLSPRERILIDGRMLPEKRWLELANTLYSLVEGSVLTYFETVTLLAVLAFHDVEVAVFETGLGGSFDATTALDRGLILFTPIGMDHEQILGRDIATIARDKAGVLGPGVRAISAHQPEQALAVLRERATEAGSLLETVADHFRFQGEDILRLPEGTVFLQGVRLVMEGSHQKGNALLGLAGWGALSGQKGWPSFPGACKEGLARTRVPGRLQRVSGAPEIILDGAHNGPAFEAMAGALLELGIRPRAAIFTCLKDKQVAPIADVLNGLSLERILVPELPGNPRAYPAAELASLLGPRAHPVRNILEALTELKDEPAPVLVCGSLYLLAEFFRLRPDLVGLSDPA